MAIETDGLVTREFTFHTGVQATAIAEARKAGMPEEEIARKFPPMTSTEAGLPASAFLDFSVWNRQFEAAEEARHAAEAKTAALEARPIRRLLRAIEPLRESALSVPTTLRRAATRAIPALAPILGGQRQAA